MHELNGYTPTTSAQQAQAEAQSNRLQIELLKRDVQLVEKLIEKVSESIEKTQQVNIQLGKIISVHEQKHKQYESDHIELKQDIKDMDDKINTVKKEITEQIEKVEERLSDKLDELRDELKETKRPPQDFPGFLKENHKLTYMALGAVVVIAWIVSNVNLSSLATFFK